MLNYKQQETIEVVVDTVKGESKKEFIVKKIDPKEEAQARRKAYDIHLKQDLIIHGKFNQSMNKTYDPYYHGHLPVYPPHLHPYNGYAPYVPKLYQDKNTDTDSKSYQYENDKK